MACRLSSVPILGGSSYFYIFKIPTFLFSFAMRSFKCRALILLSFVVVVVVDLPLLRVAVEGSDNPVSLEKPCQASLPPDQQGRHSLGRQPEV